MDKMAKLIDGYSGKVNEDVLLDLIKGFWYDEIDFQYIVKKIQTEIYYFADN